MRIVGIDPGIARVGWGVIEDRAGKQQAVDYGLFETKTELNMEQRLELISEFAEQVLDKYQPEIMAVEQLFFAANSKTAMIVGQARGAVLVAAARKNCPAVAYTPLQVKQALTGYGRADKKQIQQMVKRILRIRELKQDDTADALAVAITHAFFAKIRELERKLR